MSYILWLLGSFLAYALVTAIENNGDLKITPDQKTIVCLTWPITSLAIVAAAIKGMS